MSKILSDDEAKKIVKLMLGPLGFEPTILDVDRTASSSERFRACNSRTVTKKKGFLWWKKTITEVELDPVFTGWCWEEVIEKMDNWIKTRAAPRVVLAEKFRDEYAQKENAKALDDELSKS